MGQFSQRPNQLFMGIAYLKQTSKSKTAISTQRWTSKLIIYLWEYTSALWEFHNGVLHGHTQDENEQMEIAKVTAAINEAHKRYNEDPFIVPRVFTTDL